MQIEIDFDVFKTLTAMRKNEATTYNDVLRSVLELPDKLRVESSSQHEGRSLIADGVEFPHGTDFRMTHKGQWFSGKVSDGALIVNNVRYTAVSARACAITGTSVNGWKYWEARFPSQAEWQSINSLRHRKRAES